MEHEDEIRLIAYYLWEEEGCPDGRDMEHWLKAEVIWKEKHSRVDVKEPIRQTTSKTGRKKAQKKAGKP